MSSIARLVRPEATRVLGIDTSTNSLAFCVFDKRPVQWGKIDFIGQSMYDKIIDAHKKSSALKSVIDVEYVCIESAIMVRSQDVAIKMAMIVGAVISALADKNDMIVTVKPSEWQNFINNKNLTKAEKDQIKKDFPNKSESWYRTYSRQFRKQRTMDFINNKYGILIEDNDVGDASAIAHYAYNRLVSHG